MNKINDHYDHSEDDDLGSEGRTFRIPLNWFRDPSTVIGEERIDRLVHNFKMQTYFGTRGTLALQLPFMEISESMGNHDSNIVDADSVD